MWGNKRTAVSINKINYMTFHFNYNIISLVRTITHEYQESFHFSLIGLE